MAEYQYVEFLQRLRRIGDNHSKLAHGHIAVMGKDGLVVAEPKPLKTHHVARGLFLCLVVMWLFKVYLHASVGAVAYQERVTSLQNGSIFEQVGGYVMVADPVTSWIAGLFGAN